MDTTTAADRRRTRAVRRSLLRGVLSVLSSLSFGKVLLGAAMLWMAATFITAAAFADSSEPSLQLIAYSAEESDVDESDWSYSFSGEQKPTSVSNSGAQASGLDGRMATMATATPARSLAELRARHQPMATEPAAWPFMRGHGNGHAAASGSQRSMATPVTNIGHSVSRTVRAAVDPALDFAAELVDKLAGATSGGSSAGDKPVRDRESAKAQTGKTRTAVELRRTISATVDRERGNATARAAHSTAGPTTEFVEALLERLARDVAGGDATARSAAPIGDVRAQATGDAHRFQRWTERRADRPPARSANLGAGAAVKTPAAAHVDDLMGGVVDLVSGIVGTVAGKQAGAHTRQTLTNVAEQVSAALAVSNRLGNHHGAGGDGSSDSQLAMPERAPQHYDGGPGSAPEHDRRPITCLALGCTDPDPKLTGHHPGTGVGRGPPHTDRPRYQFDSFNENDPASWLSDRSRTGRTNDFIGGILEFVQDLIGRLPRADSAQSPPQRPANSGDPNGNAGADIRNLTEGFGEGQSSAGQNRGQGSRRPERDLAQRIVELTNEFVSDLIKTLGVSGSNTGGGSSGNSGGQSGNNGGSGTRPPSLGDVEQILGGVTDLVAGLVGSVAGKQAGEQARQLLATAAQDVLDALAAGDRYGQGVGQSGDGADPIGAGNSWSLNNNGQFAGVDCEGDVECALAAGDPRTRQPRSPSNRGPPQLLDDLTDSYRWDSEQTTAKALNDRLAVIQGQKNLDAAKAQLDQKKITQADYDKQTAAQQALRATADQSAAQLDPYNSQLLTDVVTGQQQLGTAKTQLAAAKTQLDQGRITQADYDRQAAAYSERRDTVYAQTAELRSTAGYGRAGQADAGNDGAGAACANTGAFAECSVAAIDPTTGELKRDQSLCLIGVSGCDSMVTAGDRAAHAACNSTDGCATVVKAGAATAQTTCGVGECNTESTVDSARASMFCQARAACSQDARIPTTPSREDLAAGKEHGLAQTSGRCHGDCALYGFATVTDAGSDCQSRHGACDTTSSGSRARQEVPEDETSAQAAERRRENGAASAKAHCHVRTVGCDTTTTVRAALDETTGQYGWHAAADERADAPTPVGEAISRCAEGATGCQGNAATNTNGRTDRTETTEAQPAVAAAGGAPGTPARPALTSTDTQAHTGAANCQIVGGDCTASSGGEDEGTLSASDVDCDQIAGCGGAANAGTQAIVTTGVNNTTATRATSARNRCTANAADGECAVDASSSATNSGTRPTVDPATQVGQGLVANSGVNTTLRCVSADCRGASNGMTSGSATGDVQGERHSASVTGCDARGVGADCGSAGSTEVSWREARTVGLDGQAATPAGPVSVSHADSRIRCTNDGDTECGGRAYTETTALDSAVSPHRRGAAVTGDCVVTGGDCLGEASSDASTVTDYRQIDPNTGKPVPGQPTSGPTATARTAASVDCRTTTCHGNAHTTSAAWDGVVDGGKPRTSEATVGCEAGATSCQVQVLSTAFTGPGAAATYAGDGQAVNAARFGTGPSAASTAGGKLTCEQGAECAGKVTLTVLATHPGVAPGPRGNRAEGACAGATGGSCTAVVNGAASTEPNANDIRPMVQDQPTSNATVDNEQLGGGAGGDDASAGNGASVSQTDQNPAGPGGQQPTQPATVPTAPGSSASSGGAGVPGASSWTTAWATLTCDGSAPCQGRPVSSATGLTGPNHADGGAGSRGPPSAGTTSNPTINPVGNTTARCDSTGAACQATSTSTAGSGQVVADVFTAQNRDMAAQVAQRADQAQQAADQAKQLATAPGATAEQRKSAEQAAQTAAEAGKAAQAAAQAANQPITNVPDSWSESTAVARCAGPDCRAAATGAATDATGSSSSTATCTAGEAGCMVTAGTMTALLLAKKPGEEPIGQGETRASVVCPESGCLASATETGAVGAEKITAKATAGCPAGAACQASTTGVATKDYAEVGADCIGTGCATHTEGSAESAAPTGRSWSTSRSDCTAGPDRRCAGQSAVTAGEEFGARASAGCASAEGAPCSYRAEAGANAKHSSGSTADASASGSDAGRPGGGQVMVGAQAIAEDRQAFAAATCAGAPDCDTRYTAHAEAYDHLEIPATYTSGGGYGDAFGEATCEGGGPNGGGCGVVAWAQAGPNGSGGGDCSGTYTSCDKDGGSNWTETDPLPLPDGHVLGPDGLPIPIEELGPLATAATGYVDDSGNVVLQTKPKNGPVETVTCPPSEPCQTSPDVRDSGGPWVGYTPGEGFDSRNPSVEGKPSDRANGTDGVGLARDEKGHGQAWIDGRGVVFDGVSGTREEVGLSFADGVPTAGEAPAPMPELPGTIDEPGNNGGIITGSPAEDFEWKPPSGDPEVNTFTLTNPRGGPFLTTCKGGCKGDIRNADIGNGVWTDHIDFAGAPSLLIGRNGFGNHGFFDFDGSGTFTSHEGDVVTLESGSAEIRTRNGAGLGGYFRIKEYFGEMLPGAGEMVCPSAMTCTYMPDLEVPHSYGNGTIHTAEDVTVECVECTKATHYLPRAPGQGGFTACELQVAGSRCKGTGAAWNGSRDVQEISSDGGRVRFAQYLRNADGSGGGAVAFVDGAGTAKGTDAYGNWVETSGAGGRMGLLYAEGDFYNVGQSCVAGKGGKCAGSAPVEGPASAYPRLPWAEPRPAGGEPEPGTPAVETPYSWEAFQYLRGASFSRWYTEVAAPKLAEAAAKIKAAQADGPLSRGERDRLLEEVSGILGPNLMDRIERDAGLLDAVQRGNNERAAAGAETVERELLEDPALVSDVFDILGAAPDPKKPAAPQAADAIEQLQGAYAQDAKALADRENALAGQVAEYEKAVTAYNKDGVGSYAELEATRKALNDERKSLNAAKDELDATKGKQLRELDQAVADAAGNVDYAADIASADESLAAVRGLANALPEARTEEDAAANEQLLKVAGAVQLGYQAAIDAPRTPSSRLGDMRLPSTGSPSVPAALRSSEYHGSYKECAGCNEATRKAIGAKSDDELSRLAGNVGPLETYLNKFDPIAPQAKCADSEPGCLANSDIPDEIWQVIHNEGGPKAKPEFVPMLYRQPPTGEKPDGECVSDYCDIGLYRVRNIDGEYRYIDPQDGAVYDDLEDYQESNFLPEDAEIIAPKDLGRDADDPLDLVSVSAHHTPDWKKAGDRIAPVASWLGTGMMLTGIGAPVGGWLLAAGTAWDFYRSGEDLVSRYMHNQPMGLDDPGARASWISLGGTALVGLGAAIRPAVRATGFLSAPAVARATAYNAGLRDAAKLASIGARVTTRAKIAGGVFGVSQVAFNGQFIDQTYMTWRDWDTMTPAQQTDAIYDLGMDAANSALPYTVGRGQPSQFGPLAGHDPFRPPLGPHKNCACVAEAWADATTPGGVDLADVRPAIAADQKTERKRRYFERKYNGHTELITADELEQRMADPGVPVGAGVFLWSEGHVIYAEKTAQGMEYYVGDQATSTKPENTRAATFRDSGLTTDPGLRLADEIGEHVGADQDELGPVRYERSLDLEALMDPEELEQYKQDNYRIDPETGDYIEPERGPNERRVSKVVDADGRAYVVYSGGDPDRLSGAIDGANVYRAAGYPVVDTRLMRTTEPIVDPATGEVVVEAGRTVQVSRFLEGSRELSIEEYSAGPVHEQVKKRFGIAFALNDFDGIQFDNLRVTPDGQLVHVDLDKVLTDYPEDIGRSFDELRGIDEAFGELSDEDIARQFVEVLRMRDQLLAAVTSDERRARLAARLDWMADWVDAHGGPGSRHPAGGNPPEPDNGPGGKPLPPSQGAGGNGGGPGPGGAAHGPDGESHPGDAPDPAKGAQGEDTGGNPPDADPAAHSFQFGLPPPKRALTWLRSPLGLAVLGNLLGVGLAIAGWHAWLSITWLANAVFVARCLVNFYKDDWARGEGRFEGSTTAFAAFTLSINLVFHLDGALHLEGWSRQISAWFFALDIAFMAPLLPLTVSWAAHKFQTWRGLTSDKWTNPAEKSVGLRRMGAVGTFIGFAAVLGSEWAMFSWVIHELAGPLWTLTNVAFMATFLGNGFEALYVITDQARKTLPWTKRGYTPSASHMWVANQIGRLSLAAYGFFALRALPTSYPVTVASLGVGSVLMVMWAITTRGPPAPPLAKDNSTTWRGRLAWKPARKILEALKLPIILALPLYGLVRLSGQSVSAATTAGMALMAITAAIVVAQRHPYSGGLSGGLSGELTGGLTEHGKPGRLMRWLRIIGRWFGLGGPPDGGPSLASHRAPNSAEAAAITGEIERALAANEIAAEIPLGDPRLDALTGLGAAEHAALSGGRTRGLRAIDGANGRIAGNGGPSDLVVWAHRDGWYYLDTAILDGLRRGILSSDEARMVFTHEATHLAHPAWTERQVQTRAPLPPTDRLNRLFGPRPNVSEVLAAVSVLERLAPEQLAALFGVPRSEVDQAGCTGMCAVRDLTSLAGEPVLADPDSGRLYIDAHALAVLRAGAADRSLSALLGFHKLDELRYRGQPPPDQALGPLPALSVLAAPVPAGHGRERLWERGHLLSRAAELPPAQAIQEILESQGRGGPPVLIGADAGRALLERGAVPIYRGVPGAEAAGRTADFLTGARPFIGRADNLTGTGHNFVANHGYAASISGAGLSPLVGYVSADAVVLDHDGAVDAQRGDIARADELALPDLARALEDLGVWAALNGIDVIVAPRALEGIHDQYLVVDRGVLLILRR